MQFLVASQKSVRVHKIGNNIFKASSSGPGYVCLDLVQIFLELDLVSNFL